MHQANDYLFGSTLSEGERLRSQAKRLEEYSCWLLDQLDLQPGMSAVDLGCGPIGILNLLAERVGAEGKVVGIDCSQLMLDLAQQSLTALGFANVQFVQAAAQATGLPAAAFDIVHARLLLDTTPEPTQMLAELTRLVRPGGIVAVHEVDFVSWLCEPPHPAWERLRTLFCQVWNGDTGLGRRLPRLLRAQGLDAVACKVHCGPQLVRTILPDFIAGPLRAPILSQKLLPEAELEALLQEIQHHLHDPETFVISPLHVQAWGRKPTS